MGVARVHPILGLGLPITEVARRAGVCRVVLSQVVHGHRDRPGRDTVRALVEAFPELDRDQLEQWSWSRARRRKAS